MALKLLLILFMSFILLQEMICSPCPLVRTKFPSRVMYTCEAKIMAKASGESVSSLPQDDAERQMESKRIAPAGFEAEILKAQRLESRRRRDPRVTTTLIRLYRRIAKRLQPDQYPL